jgi:hypothetical protein
MILRTPKRYAPLIIGKRLMFRVIVFCQFNGPCRQARYLIPMNAWNSETQQLRDLNCGWVWPAGVRRVSRATPTSNPLGDAATCPPRTTACQLHSITTAPTGQPRIKDQFHSRRADTQPRARLLTMKRQTQ